MSCSKKRKSVCLPPDCNWIVGSGCRSLRPRQPKSGCTTKRKADCLSPCNWIVGSGCKSPSYQPRSPRSPRPQRAQRARAPGCTSKRKANCLPPDCNWIVGSGCKSPSYQPRSPRRSRPPKPPGCTSKKKADCLPPDCDWIRGSGCKSPSYKPRSRSRSAYRQEPKKKITIHVGDEIHSLKIKRNDTIQDVRDLLSGYIKFSKYHIEDIHNTDVPLKKTYRLWDSPTDEYVVIPVVFVYVSYGDDELRVHSHYDVSVSKLYETIDDNIQSSRELRREIGDFYLEREDGVVLDDGNKLVSDYADRDSKLVLSITKLQTARGEMDLFDHIKKVLSTEIFVEEKTLLPEESLVEEPIVSEENPNEYLATDVYPYLSKKGQETFDELHNRGELNCILDSKMRLKPVQFEAVLHTLVSDDPFLVVFGTGVGKTITALTASLCYLEKYPSNKVIVISPKSVINNFPKEYNKYMGRLSVLPDSFMFFTYDGFYNYQKKQGSNICENAMIIVDEAHTYREFKSSRATRVFSCFRRRNTKIIFLTATPVVNNEKELAQLVRLMFYDEYQEKGIDIYGNLEGNIVYEMSTGGFFPEIREHEVLIEMSELYQKTMYKLIEDYLTEVNYRIPFYFLNRQLVNTLGEEEMISEKLTYVVEKLLQHPDKKAMIYTSWINLGVQLMKDTMDKIGVTYVSIIGSLDDHERNEAVRAYNNNEARVFIISPAASLGIDLKETELVFIFDPVWNNANIKQIVGRAARHLSHASLPLDRQFVDVYYLKYIEKDLEPHDSHSGDIILYRFIESKKILEDEIHKKLYKISINYRE